MFLFRRGKGRQHGLVLREGDFPALAAQVAVPQMPGDLAQPYGDFAPSVKAVGGPDGLIKGLLGQFLRQIRVMAQGEEELVYSLGVTLVDSAHRVHGPPSFHLLCVSGRAKRYTFREKILTGRSPSNRYSGTT